MELTPEFCAKMGCAYGTSLPKGSFVLGGRDSNPSSRMLKRCFMGGVLSAGVNVRDMKMTSLPLVRYKLKTFGEVGGVHFRQAQDDPALLEIVFLDGDGLDFSSGMGKNVERTFFKENFRRAHHTEPGVITDINNVGDFYREGFLRVLDRELLKKSAFTVVVDFSFSPASQSLPQLLNELGFSVIALNAYVDEGKGVKAKEKELALNQLSAIVASLGAQAGFWLDPSAEAVTLVDETGRICTGIELLSLAVSLLMKAGQKGTIAVPVQTPSTIERIADQKGCQVVRTKSSDRAMQEVASSSDIVLTGTTDGRFAFPRFQAAFDGMFAIAKLMELSAFRGIPLSQSLSEIPRSAYLQTSLPCPWEMKGGIMRKMSEDSLDKEASFIDGIKVHFGADWVLILPDQYLPVVHIVADAREQKSAEKLLSEYEKKIVAWKKEMV
jgi:mannose-1-phosphate guanylyltransferase/phosphomannomutase